MPGLGVLLLPVLVRQLLLLLFLLLLPHLLCHLLLAPPTTTTTTTTTTASPSEFTTGTKLTLTTTASTSDEATWTAAELSPRIESQYLEMSYVLSILAWLSSHISISWTLSLPYSRSLVKNYKETKVACLLNNLIRLQNTSSNVDCKSSGVLSIQKLFTCLWKILRHEQRVCVGHVWKALRKQLLRSSRNDANEALAIFAWPVHSSQSQCVL